MNVDIFAMAEKLSGAGLTTIVLLILISGWKRIWVWGYQIDECRAERDEWKRMALRGTDFAERAVVLAEKKPAAGGG